MTVPSQTPKVTHTANGTSKSFAFTFRIRKTSHLAVYVDSTLQTLGTHYSVTSTNLAAGGNVVFVNAPANGAKVRIYRNMPYSRTDFDYQTSGSFPAATINEDLDSLALQVQQIADAVSRSVSVGLLSEGVSTALPSPESLKFLRWNNAANALENADASVGAVLASAVHKAEQQTAAEGQIVFNLTNSYLPGTNSIQVEMNNAILASGIDYTETSATSITLVDPAYADDFLVFKTISFVNSPATDSASVAYTVGGSGAVARNVQDRLRDLVVSVKDKGATGDGSDQTAAFLAAAATGRPVHIPAGNYTVSAPVTFTAGIIGDGCQKSIVSLTSTGQFVVGDWYVTWRGFKLKSDVNNKVFVSNPAQSYFIYEDFVIEKIGSATGQIGLDFDCSINSIYYNRIDNFVFRVDYPVNIKGASSHVFNANKIGACVGGNKWYNFASAITVNSSVAACDANTFGGYFETGTNVLTFNGAALRQNRFDLILDAVTRVWNSTVNVTDANTWHILDGGFTYTGNQPQNQIFIGPQKTVVRATENASTGAITSASLTTMTFDTEDIDALAEFTPGTGSFTPKYNGYYNVSAQCLTQSYTWPSGSRFECRIYKNGALYAAGEYNASETSSAVSIPRSAGVSAVMYLLSTDVVTIRLLHNRGANTTLETSPANNFLSIYRVA